MIEKLIKPFGHRILVKIEEKTETKSGLVMPEGTEPEFLAWGKVVALPEHNLNKFINTLKIGDEVAFMHFEKDRVVDKDTGESFLMLEAEQGGGVKGQIVAVKHK